MLRFILYAYIFKIAYRIERGVAIESAVFLMLALNMKGIQEFVYHLGRTVSFGDGMFGDSPVGILCTAYAMTDADTCNRMQCNEGLGILAAMIVGTLHQCALRVGIAHLHIYTHWSAEVAQDTF